MPRRTKIRSTTGAACARSTWPRPITRSPAEYAGVAGFIRAGIGIHTAWDYTFIGMGPFWSPFGWGFYPPWGGGFYAGYWGGILRGRILRAWRQVPRPRQSFGAAPRRRFRGPVASYAGGGFHGGGGLAPDDGGWLHGGGRHSTGVVVATRGRR